MILWRPTNNNQRYAFTPLLDSGDESEEDDIVVTDHLGIIFFLIWKKKYFNQYSIHFFFSEGMKMRVSKTNSNGNGQSLKDEPTDSIVIF